MRNLILAGALLLAPAPALADVAASDANGFTVTETATLNRPAAEVWARLGEIGRWWSDAHTYSGAAANMTLSVQAGGCFCEAWGGGNSVEHGRVILAMPGQILRLDAPLGPLQEMAITGILTFTLQEGGGRTTLTMSFQAAGRPSVQLAGMGPLVDTVLGEQFARLTHYVETGAAE